MIVFRKYIEGSADLGGGFLWKLRYPEICYIFLFTLRIQSSFPIQNRANDIIHTYYYAPNKMLFLKYYNKLLLTPGFCIYFIKNFKPHFTSSAHV